MAVKLDSRLGNVGFKIEATLRNGRAEQAEQLAMQHLVFHKAGSKAFGKKGGHPDRAEAFSPALAADVQAALEDSLGGLYEGIKIETFAYVPSAPDAEKLIASLEKIGFDVAALRKQEVGKNGESNEESVG